MGLDIAKSVFQLHGVPVLLHDLTHRFAKEGALAGGVR
jgi:hypothetical protein